MSLEPLEERHVLSGGLFSVLIDGLVGTADEEKVAAAQSLFQSAGLSDQQIVALGVVDPNERILVQAPADASVEDLDQELAPVPGYRDVSDFDPTAAAPEGDEAEMEEGDDAAALEAAGIAPADDSDPDDGSGPAEEDNSAANIAVGLTGNEPTIAINPTNSNNIVIAQRNGGSSTLSGTTRLH